MKKRGLAFFLCAALLCALWVPLIPAASAADIADSGTCGENLTWTLDSDGVLTISGTGEMEDYDWLWNLPPWGTEVKSVMIENGVTNIGEYAFFECSALTNITIPGSVKYIGFYAFYGCYSLLSITIPEGVTALGPSALSNCGLISVTLPKSLTSIGAGAFASCFSLKDVSIPNAVTSIGSAAFDYCIALTSITIPASVTNIGVAPFGYCRALAEIHVDENNAAYCNDEYGVLFSKDKTELIEAPENAALEDYAIPQSVTNIKDYAFFRCKALKRFTIPANVTNIGEGAFLSCNNLKSVGFEGNAPSVGPYAFYTRDELTSEYSIIPGLTLYYIEGKSGWTTPTWGSDAYPTGAWNGVNVPIESGTCGENLTWTLDSEGVLTISGTGEMEDYWDNPAPWGTEIKTVVIENGVTSIGSEAFHDCTALASITLPGSVAEIGGSAFAGCSGLTSIIIPDGVTAIGDYAFAGCSGLTSFAIPKSVTRIRWGTFSICTGLTSITIPEGVVQIEDYAFNGCTGLTSITIPESVMLIQFSAFGGCTGLTSITIPKNVAGIAHNAFESCSSLMGIWVDKDNIEYSSDELGFLYNKAKTALLFIPQKATLGNYTVRDGVTSIGSAFKGRTDLTSVIIPESVTSIEPEAFWGCSSLTDITIPEGVTSIQISTFAHCTALTNIVLPESLTCIEETAFYECRSLKSVTIPESITNIGDNAFTYCDALASVCFKGNAPEIGDGVFTTYDKNKHFDVIPGLTLYYIEGKEGWTTPEWNGYPTATWDGVNVPKGHEHDYKATVTAPTCTEKGYTTYVCSCGSSYVADELAALGHAWDEGKVTTAPTTEKEGVKTFTCTRCNLIRTEPIAKLQITVSFKDVDEKAYYAAAVEWAVAKNITKGTAADTFAPNDTCTRGQIVTFLWRAAGEPTPSGTKNPFTDVKQRDYWYNAVLWAVEQGITTGTSATTFSPNEGCTRGQVATFLWRYENKPTPAAKNPFEDVKQGAYYYDAVLWAVDADVTKGTSATAFAPNDTCTRGQIVTFLYRDIA